MMVRLLVICVMLVTSNAAAGKNIAICGASTGYAYYAKAGLMVLNEGGEGWHQDAISNGRITLFSNEGRLDVLYADATGGVKSATADGGQVVLVGRNAEALVVVVNYPKLLVETYTFRKSANGAEVIWSSNKYGTPLPKLGAYRAPCSFLSFQAPG